MTLKAFVSDSALPQEDKDLWFSILENLDVEQIKTLEDFVDNDPKKLVFLTNNLKAKREAFQSGDSAALEEVLKSEENLSF